MEMHVQNVKVHDGTPKQAEIKAVREHFERQIESYNELAEALCRVEGGVSEGTAKLLQHEMKHAMVVARTTQGVYALEQMAGMSEKSYETGEFDTQQAIHLLREIFGEGEE